MRFIKTRLPVVLCCVVGALCFLQYYVPHRAAQNLLENINKTVLITGFFAYLLGVISVTAPHFRKMAAQTDGWGYSAVLFIGLAIGLGAGLASRAQFVTAQGALTAFGWMYSNMLYPLQSAIYSLLGFYVVSASYRSFRIKSGPAFVMFAAAAILLCGRVPATQALLGGVNWLAPLMEWLLNVPAVAARRGIMIGIALGSIALSVKILTGLERKYMGGGE